MHAAPLPWTCGPPSEARIPLPVALANTHSTRSLGKSCSSRHCYIPLHNISPCDSITPPHRLTLQGLPFKSTGTSIPTDELLSVPSPTSFRATCAHPTPSTTRIMCGSCCLGNSRLPPALITNTLTPSPATPNAHIFHSVNNHPTV